MPKRNNATELLEEDPIPTQSPTIFEMSLFRVKNEKGLSAVGRSPYKGRRTSYMDENCQLEPAAVAPKPYSGIWPRCTDGFIAQVRPELSMRLAYFERACSSAKTIAMYLVLRHRAVFSG